jgi:hypothetical protein
VISDVPTYGLRREDVLCLSGGGYRAALFHLGALTRLNELGLLARTGTVGGVAGGSILAALLATKVPWPLQGAFGEWPQAVAEPMRALAGHDLRVKLRSPISGAAAKGALEERFARELAGSIEANGEKRPRFVFGAAGLTLGRMTGGEEPGAQKGLRWEIGDSASGGYSPTLVADVIAAVRADLDPVGDAEQAVLENHGYTLAEAAVRAGEHAQPALVKPPPPEPPHPHWTDEQRVCEALAGSGRRSRLGWLRSQRAERGERTFER